MTYEIFDTHKNVFCFKQRTLWFTNWYPLYGVMFSIIWGMPKPWFTVGKSFVRICSLFMTGSLTFTIQGEPGV